MTRKVAAALIVGLLVGLLIGTLLPVEAGARRSVDRRSLESRVARLERRTQYLGLDGTIGPDHERTTRCASGDPAVWQSLNGLIFKLGCRRRQVRRDYPEDAASASCQSSLGASRHRRSRS